MSRGYLRRTGCRECGEHTFHALDCPLREVTGVEVTSEQRRERPNGLSVDVAEGGGVMFGLATSEERGVAQDESELQRLSAAADRLMFLANVELEKLHRRQAADAVEELAAIGITTAAQSNGSLLVDRGSVHELMGFVRRDMAKATTGRSDGNPCCPECGSPVWGFDRLGRELGRVCVNCRCRYVVTAEGEAQPCREERHGA